LKEGDAGVKKEEGRRCGLKMGKIGKKLEKITVTLPATREVKKQQ